MLKTKIIPIFIIFISFFICFFLYTKIFGPISFSVNNTTTTKTDVFSVSGEGKAIVKPDIANITVGINNSGSTTKQVQDKINSIIKNITNSLKKLGIDGKDIKTANYNISPTYDWTSGRQKITGFNANTNLSIKVRDIDKINEIIDSATANGANQIRGISFDVDNKTELEEVARKEAVTEAKKKAKDIAKITGFKLGKIINYSESNNNTPRTIGYGGLGLKNMESTAVDTDIQTGSSEIKISVTLSYQIE
jgi:uncharacterized protein